MSQPTHDHADLLLQLFELRREPKLREARQWVFAEFHPRSGEEMMSKFPPGSEGNTRLRMVVSYWEMAAALVNRGLIDEELFFETTGEQWAIWESMKPVIGTLRERFKNPFLFSNLERHAHRLEEWREKRAPGTTETMREFMAAMVAQAR